jgi:sarcosine oxidase subunit beta
VAGGSFDVVVVGGGVIGGAVALELAGRGVGVLLLERAALAAGASGRNQGLLLPNPDPAYLGLFHESVAAHRRLAEAGLPFDLRPVPQLLLGAEDDVLAAAAEEAAALAAAGFAVQRLGPGELVAAEPWLAPDLAGGFRVEGAFALDPAGVTLAWAAAARRAGATVRTHDPVRRLLVDRGRVTGVLADSGRVACGAVVLAAGPWSRALAAQGAHATLPVGGARGWLLQTDPLPWRAAHAVVEAVWPGPAGVGAQARPPTLADLAAAGPAHADPGDQGTAFTLQQGLAGQAVIGASLAASLREDPERPETVRGLARRALRFAPALAQVPLAAAWSGVRPVSPDGYPIVGPLPQVEGLWAVTGHGPEGVQLAPPSARMLAQHLVGGTAAPDAAPFDPARFPAVGAPTGGNRAVWGGARHAGRAAGDCVAGRPAPGAGDLRLARWRGGVGGGRRQAQARPAPAPPGRPRRGPARRAAGRPLRPGLVAALVGGAAGGRRAAGGRAGRGRAGRARGALPRLPRAAPARAGRGGHPAPLGLVVGALTRAPSRRGGRGFAAALDGDDACRSGKQEVPRPVPAGRQPSTSRR